MSAIETALTELSANLRRMEQRHQATGYKFDRLYDLIDAARGELATLTAPVELPEPYSVTYDDVGKEEVKLYAEGQVRFILERKS